MSYTIKTEEDARQLCSMSNKPHKIIINWNANESPNEEYINGIIHPNLTSLNAKLHERADNNSWSCVLRGSHDTSLKILKVSSIRGRENLPRAISSLAVSQLVSNTLTILWLRNVHFDEIRSSELNKTLEYFACLRHLYFSSCIFDGPVNQAIKHSFSIDYVFWNYSHRGSFQELMHPIIDSSADRNSKRFRYFIDISNSKRVGTEEKHILKHFIASLEKVSAAKVSSFLLNDVLPPGFELRILRYFSI